jgi:hypothetical protein
MGVSEDLERLGRLLDEGKLTTEEFEQAKAALLAGGAPTTTSPAGSTNPPPGWYPDPHGRTGTSAWWSGTEWTGATQPTQPATTPVIVQQTKKSGGCLRAVLIVGFLTVALAYCFGSNLNGPAGDNTNLDFDDLDVDASCSVVYSVGGTASSASLTLTNASGNTEQLESVSIPWTRTLTMPCGDFVYVSAQNNGASGSVTCRITSDGASIETAESSGAYVIATCSGSA